MDLYKEEDHEVLVAFIFRHMEDVADENGFEFSDQELRDMASEFVENGCDF
jgi:hypothetical protein